MASPPSEASPEDRQRIDKWLWFARVAKTRTTAARLVEDGHIRINSVRIEQAAKLVRAGDVVTVALDRAVRVLKVLGTGQRRGPASEARLLFQDLSGTDASQEGSKGRPAG